ncbi:MAG: hypothetical protein H6745_05490 [Deltaproteobacteria bacterium]|nr:hypothetical protein [Deltaproteobacteria bacterium]
MRPRAARGRRARALSGWALVVAVVALGLGLAGACAEPVPIEGAGCDPAHRCPSGFVCAGGACQKLRGKPVVQCTEDAQCAVGHCLVELGFCVQCRDSADCFQTACLTDVFQCGCRDGSQCATGRCNAETGTCVSCFTDAQCASGHCDRESGICAKKSDDGAGDAEGTGDGGDGAPSRGTDGDAWP